MKAFTHWLISLIVATSALASPDAELVAAGRTALARGDLENAITQLEKAVAANGMNAQAHYQLGVAYARQVQAAGGLGALWQTRKMRDEWLRAAELDPKLLEARFRLIEFYVMAPGLAGGSDDKAMQQAAEVRKLDAVEGHRAFAGVYTLQKRPDLATKEMDEAARNHPASAKAHYWLGNALVEQKSWKAALDAYDKTLELEPAYMPAYFRIGLHAAQSGSNYARGEAALRRYLEYKPGEEEPPPGRAWYWLGVIQEKQGRHAEARNCYLKAQKLVPEAKDVTEALKRVS